MLSQRRCVAEPGRLLSPAQGITLRFVLLYRAQGCCCCPRHY